MEMMQLASEIQTIQLKNAAESESTSSTQQKPKSELEIEQSKSDKMELMAKQARLQQLRLQCIQLQAHVQNLQAASSTNLQMQMQLEAQHYALQQQHVNNGGAPGAGGGAMIGTTTAIGGSPLPPLPLRHHNQSMDHSINAAGLPSPSTSPPPTNNDLMGSATQTNRGGGTRMMMHQSNLGNHGTQHSTTNQDRTGRVNGGMNRSTNVSSLMNNNSSMMTPGGGARSSPAGRGGSSGAGKSTTGGGATIQPGPNSGQTAYINVDVGGQPCPIPVLIVNYATGDAVVMKQLIQPMLAMQLPNEINLRSLGYQLPSTPPQPQGTTPSNSNGLHENGTANAAQMRASPQPPSNASLSSFDNQSLQQSSFQSPLPQSQPTRGGNTSFHSSSAAGGGGPNGGHHQQQYDPNDVPVFQPQSTRKAPPGFGTTVAQNTSANAAEWVPSPKTGSTVKLSNDSDNTPSKSLTSMDGNLIMKAPVFVPSGKR
eukprot:g1899.t1